MNETLEVILSTLAGIAILDAVGFTFLFTIGMSASMSVEYEERKKLIEKVMPDYRAGFVKTKPTLFNIYSLVDINGYYHKNVHSAQ